MKTAFISVLAATLLGFASLASGRAFDVANFAAIMFTTGLVAWTIDQYNRAPRQLTAPRSIRFPVRAPARSAKTPVIRLAA